MEPRRSELLNGLGPVSAFGLTGQPGRARSLRQKSCRWPTHPGRRLTGSRDPAGEYRVLYASSQRVGTFLETLARYRTDPAIVAAYEEIASEQEDLEQYPTIAPGVVPPR